MEFAEFWLFTFTARPLVSLQLRTVSHLQQNERAQKQEQREKGKQHSEDTEGKMCYTEKVLFSTITIGEHSAVGMLEHSENRDR